MSHTIAGSSLASMASGRFGVQRAVCIQSSYLWREALWREALCSSLWSSLERLKLEPFYWSVYCNGTLLARPNWNYPRTFVSASSTTVEHRRRTALHARTLFSVAWLPSRALIVCVTCDFQNSLPDSTGSVRICRLRYVCSRLMERQQKLELWQ